MTIRSIALAGLCAATAVACATGDSDLAAKSPEDRNPAWFECEKKFECVAVVDSYCKEVAVNRKYALVYQDWTHERLQHAGALQFCELSGRRVGSAICRNGVCGLGPTTKEIFE